MKKNQDIRWEQRFSNYKKALNQLIKAITILNNKNNYDKNLSDIIQEALIKRFEFTHELAWKVMKDYAEYQGNINIIRGSRDAYREAFKMEIIENEDDAKTWLFMIKSRNLSTHTYNEKTADDIAKLIIENYFPLFMKFETKMNDLMGKKEKKLFDTELWNLD